MKKYPAVFFFEFPPETSLAILLGGAIARARGDVLALTDSACLVAGDWAAAILRAHEKEESPVIGGTVEKTEGGNLTEWAAYFCDYSAFMPPLPDAAAAVVVPGNNFSIKRPILEREPEYAAPEFWKTLWCRRLQASGIRLVSDSSIRVAWRKKYRLAPFLGRRFHQGRCFAGMRFAGESFLRRVFYSFGAVFLPLVFLARIAAPVLQKKKHLGKFLLSLPVIVLAVVFWSAGESAGFLLGTGTSCARID